MDRIYRDYRVCVPDLVFFATACDGGTIGGLQTPGREKAKDGLPPLVRDLLETVPEPAPPACPSSPSQEQRRMLLGIRNPGNHVHMTSNFSLLLLEGTRDASASLVFPPVMNPLRVIKMHPH